MSGTEKPKKLDLITHPLRARIVSQLGGRALTTHQLASLLPDIPLPSLYRHLRLLTEGGVIEPVEEVRVNGAAVKVYSIVAGQTYLRPDELTGATAADHIRYFNVFLETLSAQFASYLAQEDSDPQADSIEAMMGTLCLTPAETEEFKQALQRLIQEWSERPHCQGSRRLVFARILFPDLPEPPLLPPS